jgi:hypothetical protein
MHGESTTVNSGLLLATWGGPIVALRIQGGGIMKILAGLVLGAALAGAIAMPASAASIDNPANGGTIDAWGPSAIGGGQSYGEIFTAAGSVLNDFTFTVAGDSYPFVAQVYAWNGVGATGPALYTSGIDTLTGTLTSYTFNPNIGLIAGNLYVAFVTNQPSGVSLGGSGSGYMAASDGGTGGFFEFAEGDPSVAANWETYPSNAEFHADFSGSVTAVPEPVSLSLFGAGLAGAAFIRRRKAKA